MEVVGTAPAGVLEGASGGVVSTGFFKVRGIGGGDLIEGDWAVVAGFWKTGVVVSER